MIYGRVSTRKNQLLQNQLSSNVARTPTCKNLLVQISQFNSSSIKGGHLVSTRVQIRDRDQDLDRPKSDLDRLIVPVYPS